MKGRFRLRAIDPRVVVGAGLILASVAGVWFVVDAADRSSPVLVAASTLSVGDTLSEDDLDVAHVRLDKADARYLARVPDGGLVVTRTVFKGEIIPLSAVKASAHVQVRAVVVESATRLPGSVVTGSLVDVWAAERSEDGSFAPPVVVVGGAGVVEVIEQQGLVSSGASNTVELLVPTGSVALLLAAIAGESAISIVPAG
ncbi:MAG: flagella basal body P-ring formation protein FlgA [Mycetocola sp.]